MKFSECTIGVIAYPIITFEFRLHFGIYFPTPSTSVSEIFSNGPPPCEIKNPSHHRGTPLSIKGAFLYIFNEF